MYYGMVRLTTYIFEDYQDILDYIVALFLVCSLIFLNSYWGYNCY